MIRMRVFKFNMAPFDYSYQDRELKDDQSDKGRAKYQKKLAQREEEYAPIEEFISEIGFENMHKITTTSDSVGCLTYTIFYEDNGRGRK